VSARRRKPCDYPHLPHGVHNRLYLCGWRCTLHTPRALRGLPEIPPGPGWPPGNYLNRIALEDQEQPHDDRTIPPDSADAGQPSR
jgi:hypothetical protein